MTLYERQHGFRPGYSCESQVIMVCQDISDELDNGNRIDGIIVDISKAFDLVPHGRLLVTNCKLGRGCYGRLMYKGIPPRTNTESQGKKGIIRRR